jgi:iron(III) transport system substrate-binding protein
MLKLTLGLGIAVFLTTACAQAQDTVDVARAKAEGKVNWYTSMPIEQAQKIVALFRRQTGIQVESMDHSGVPVLTFASNCG